MRRPETPLYLERRTYWRRRRIDAVRMLPIVGVLLFLAPFLAIGGGEGAGSTARGGLFIFAAWAGLIVVAGWLSHSLTAREGDGADAVVDPAPDERPR